MPLRARACLLALLLCSYPATVAHAQGVGINATGAAADTSAILDLAATNKGFLPPRMTAVQRGAIVLPATGLVVYQSDGVTGLYWNAGTPGAPAWKQVAEAGATGGSQWSASGANLYYSGGNVSVGTASVSARFTVVDSLNGLRVQTNTPGGTLASFGGYGAIRVDAPGVGGGRLTMLENGNFGLGRTTPVSRLDVLGGNWDVVNGEGDLRIGDGTYRLKTGIATSGGGAGGATVMQQGLPGGYNVLALGAQGNKVLYVNGGLQRVGIGVDAPTAPLGFAAATGKKITLYPGPSGDYGFGISAGRLQIASEAAATDVAIGYDAAGTFFEKFAFKNNGALAVNGSAGGAGQVLQSNGAGASPSWVSSTNTAFANVYQAISTTIATLTPASPPTTVPGLSQTFSVAGNARVIVSAAVPFNFHVCTLCPMAGATFEIMTDGAFSNMYSVRAENGYRETFSATLMVEVGPGTHNILVRAHSHPTYNLNVGGSTLPTTIGTLTLQVIPQ